jgi:hypothetical protein
MSDLEHILLSAVDELRRAFVRLHDPANCFEGLCEHCDAYRESLKANEEFAEQKRKQWWRDDSEDDMDDGWEAA